jgi:hypothetical protein
MNQPENLVYHDIKGRVWYPFQINYESEGAPFGFHVYALSEYHAGLVLEDIMATAKVGHQVVEIVRNN